MSKGKIVCSMCEEEVSNYIHILNGILCEKCEKEILSIDPEDVKYEYYNLILKKMWHEFLISI